MKNKKLKSILLAISSIGVSSIPIAAAVSCGQTDSIRFLTNKTDIQDEMKKFSNEFEKTEGAKVSKAKFRWDSTETSKMLADIASSQHSKRFPAAFRLPDINELKTLHDDGYILKFSDPKYNASGNPTVNDAEQKNTAIAGSKVNELIKYLETHGESSYMTRDPEGNIIGLPSFIEYFGIIYNKDVFKAAGIENVVYPYKDGTGKQAGYKVYDNTKTQNKNTNSIFEYDNTNNNKLKGVKVDKTKNTLYVSDLDKEHLIALRKYLDDTQTINKIKNAVKATTPNQATSQMGNYKGSMGTSLQGEDSSTITDKMMGWATLTRLGNLSGLKFSGIKFPNDQTADLSPKNLQDKIKNNTNFPSTVTSPIGSTGNPQQIFEDVAEMYVKGIQTYNSKSDGYSAVYTGDIAMTPGGIWREEKIPHEVQATAGDHYGMLPLSIGTQFTKNSSGDFAPETPNNSKFVPYVGRGTNPRWYFTNQKNGADRSAEDAVKVQTKAINFYYHLFFSKEGKQLTSNLGFGNAYDAQQTFDAKKHPLTSDAFKMPAVNPGSPFNITGEDDPKGMSRKNNDFVKVWNDYKNNPNPTTLKAIWTKIKALWQ